MTSLRSGLSQQATRSTRVLVPEEKLSLGVSYPVTSALNKTRGQQLPGELSPLTKQNPPVGFRSRSPSPRTRGRLTGELFGVFSPHDFFYLFGQRLYENIAQNGGGLPADWGQTARPWSTEPTACSFALIAQSVVIGGLRLGRSDEVPRPTAECLNTPQDPAPVGPLSRVPACQPMRSTGSKTWVQDTGSNRCGSIAVFGRLAAVRVCVQSVARCT